MTRLSDGQVLVTGGLTSGTYLTSVERYDPATGQFTWLNPMPAGRYRHTATLLLDGRVLVVGGFTTGGTVTNTTSIFNPSTGAWTAAAPTAVGHAFHTATRLPNGQVVIVAGCQTAGSTLMGGTRVEIYDPPTNQWWQLTYLPLGRYGHRTVTLPNGNLFVVGGLYYDSYGSVPAYEISPAGAVTERPSPFPSRTSHLAFTLPDGKVLIAGGTTSGPMSELYDPATQQFTATANQPSPSMNRRDAVGTVLGDGRVLIAGGYSDSATTTLFNPWTGVWSASSPLVAARWYAEAATLNDGSLLVVGGTGPGNVYLSSAEVLSEPCLPLTCAAGACGSMSDNCGGTIDCGTCGSGQTCNANACCAPTTCAALGATCGSISDGCGGTLDCGTCSSGVCSGNSCCTPTTCAAQGAQCGTISNGCGGTLSCGSCNINQGQSCSSNLCITCVPITCSQIGSVCGSPSDGCGGTILCGSCTSGNVCSGGSCYAADLVAFYDSSLKAPRCSGLTRSCDSNTLLSGRAGLGPEVNAPNSVGNSCADGTIGVFHVDESIDRLRVSSLDGGLLLPGSTARIDATVWANSSTSSSYLLDTLDLYYTTNPSNPFWTYITSLWPTHGSLSVLSTNFTIPNVGASTDIAIRGRFRSLGNEGVCIAGARTDTDDLVFSVPGATFPSPSIAFEFPSSGATIRGSYQTSVTTSLGSIGTTAVQYYAGARYLGASGVGATNPTYFTWNSALVPDGPTPLTARAFNRAGLMTGSAQRPVTIDNTAPTVALTSPAAGSVLRGTVSLTATASDAVAVSSVAFLVDGAVIGTDTSAPYEASWSGTSGAHTIQARATDTVFNTRTTSAISVTVDNAPPSVAITSPAEGASVHGAISVTANVSDASGIARVDLYEGATLLGSATSAPFTISWNTVFAGEGAHAIQLVATDAPGNTATSATRNVVVNNAPSITLTAPAASSTVSGTTQLSANASALDGRSISQVEFFVDGALVGTASSSPFAFAWSSRTVSNGAHAVTARATDSASFTTTTASTDITTDNDFTAPQVSVSSPLAGSVLRSIVTLAADATDDRGVSRVEFYVDATWVGTASTAPFVVTWNASYAAEGGHAITAVATDSASNGTTSAAVSVSVNNVPTIALTAPAASSTVTGVAQLSADATAVDGQSISQVEFFVDGALVGTVSGSPFTFAWSSRSVPNGAHAVTARATDSRSLTATTSATDITTSNDFTPPQVSVSSPLNGAVLRGFVNLAADATDDQGVSSVAFYVDGTWVGTAGAAPFIVGWNAVFAGEGGHAITAVATDTAGNTATSSVTSVLVSNVPLIVLTAPAASSTVSGLTQLSADAAAVEGHSITQVEFFVDGALVATVSNSPYTFGWNSRTVANGAHAVTARATESASLTSTTAATGITTNNDFTPPQVSVTNPVAAAALRGVINLTANASDAAGVTQVDFFVDGALVGSSSAAPYSFAWNSAGASNGNHTVVARAIDAFANAADSQPVTFSVDNQLPATAITAPAANAWVLGVVTVTASASDNTAVTRVEFYDGATLIGADLASPWQASWNTAGMNGAHALTSKAFDAAGNSSTSAAVIVNVLTSQLATYDSVSKAPKCATPGISCDTGASLVLGRGPLGPEPSQPNTIGASCDDGTSGTFHGSGESLDRLKIETVSGGALTAGAQVRVTATIWARNGNDRLDIWRSASASSPSWVLVATLTPTVFDASSTLQTTFTLPAGTTQAIRGSLRRNGSAVACPTGNNNDHDDLIFVTQ